MSTATGGQAAIYVHNGDLIAGEQPYTVPTGLLVTGSLQPGACLKADGDVYVRGDVYEASIMSKNGRIAVQGQVIGSEQHRGVLCAESDIVCGGALHADLVAGHDIRLLSTARQSMLQAAGNLHLQHSLEHSLIDVRVRLGGGVVGAVYAPDQRMRHNQQRQHVRVAVALPAAIATQDGAPPRFRPCIVQDLSAGGARCLLSGQSASEQARGDIVQLKLELPDSQDQVVIIAHVVRVIAPGLIGLAFLHLTHYDRQRVKLFCLQNVLERTQQAKLGLQSDRKASEPAERLRAG